MKHISPTGEVSMRNAIWEANRWATQPANMPTMFDLSYVRQLDGTYVDTTAFVEEPQTSSSPAQPVSASSEDDPRRYRYHSALYSAAMQADVAEVQQILRNMSQHGLPPGPAALHSLVFAHVKAGHAETGLEAARNIVHMGLPLLEETYIALVYGLVEGGKVDLAEGVIMSMYNAGCTTRHGVPFLLYSSTCSSFVSINFRVLSPGEHPKVHARSSAGY